MKILFLSFSFSRGGAALAARSTLRVVQNFAQVRAACAEASQLEGVAVENPRGWRDALHRLLSGTEYLLLRILSPRGTGKHSANCFSSPAVLEALRQAREQGEQVHVHWVNNSTLSVRQFSRLPPGSVVTLHDEWLYSATEHFCLRRRQPPAATGYRWRWHQPLLSLVDVWVWRRKLAALEDRDDILYTVPSSWMQERASSSVILRDKCIKRLPNVIATDLFVPASDIQRDNLRAAWGVAPEQRLIAFGAIDGNKNPVKGGAFLSAALQKLAAGLSGEQKQNTVLLLFGAGTEGIAEYGGLRSIGLGHRETREQMCEVYQGADCVAVPSRVESFGQVAAEALACACPVVAFDNSGLRDIVQHGENGLLAVDGDVDALAGQLVAMLNLSGEQRRAMGVNGRTFVEANFSAQALQPQWQALYQEAQQLGG